MSRHEIAGHKLGSKVIVGWDPPMQTYFVQVHYAGSRREGPDVWLGGFFRDFPELDDLKQVVWPHAELAPEILATLDADRAEDR